MYPWWCRHYPVNLLCFLTPVQCPELTLDNGGEITFSGGSPPVFGDEVDYSCFESYVPVGTNPRICQADGTWSGTAFDCVRGKMLCENFLIWIFSFIMFIGIYLKIKSSTAGTSPFCCSLLTPVYTVDFNFPLYTLKLSICTRSFPIIVSHVEICHRITPCIEI